jgi:hypothetical protein
MKYCNQIQLEIRLCRRYIVIKQEKEKGKRKKKKEKEKEKETLLYK